MSPTATMVCETTESYVPAVIPSALPSASSNDLVLVPATLAECKNTWVLNFQEWCGPLALPQYIDRERFLLKQDLTNNNQATTWILTSTQLPNEPDGTRYILAACETLLKKAYVVRNGNIDNVLSHGIGSVYTRPEHRGKGYAGRMMTELGRKLEKWQQNNDNDGVFSVLYSDIGQKFYSRFGWKAFPSTHIELKPLNTREYQDLKARHSSVVDLKTHDVKAIPTMEYLETTIKAMSLQHPDLPHVAMEPSMQQFSWHFAREQYLSKCLDLPSPDIKGAMHRDTGIAIIWSRVFSSKQQDWSLHILHIAIPPELQRSPTPEARDVLSALLLRAQHEAHVWNMAAGVEVWDPSEFVISAAQNLRTEEQGKIEVISRDVEHVCSLKWNGQRLGDDPDGKVIWVNNEKYAWC